MRVIQEDIWKESMMDQEEREKLFKEYLKEAKEYEDSEKKNTKRKQKDEYFILLQET